MKTYTVVRWNSNTITYSTTIQAQEDRVCRRRGCSSRKGEGGRELHDVEKLSVEMERFLVFDMLLLQETTQYINSQQLAHQGRPKPLHPDKQQVSPHGPQLHLNVPTSPTHFQTSTNHSAVS
jgi:hypothetical protein